MQKSFKMYCDKCIQDNGYTAHATCQYKYLLACIRVGDLKLDIT